MVLRVNVSILVIVKCILKLSQPHIFNLNNFSFNTFYDFLNNFLCFLSYFAFYNTLFDSPWTHFRSFYFFQINYSTPLLLLYFMLLPSKDHMVFAIYFLYFPDNLSFLHIFTNISSLDTRFLSFTRILFVIICSLKNL